MAHLGRDEHGLKAVTVKKEDLIKRLKENLENHKKTYETACEGFRIEIKERLDKATEQYKEGKTPSPINFVPPETHEEDYEVIISMLEMSVDEEVTLSISEYRRYAEDKWDWAERFKLTASTYTDKLLA